MSARIQIRLPQQQKAELEAAAARENKTLPEYLRDHLQDLTKSGFDIGLIEQSREGGFVISPSREVDPLDDYVMTLKKMAVARMFQNLTMNPYSTPEQQLQALRHPQALYQQPPEQKKDIMTVVAEIKALESLEKKTTDPELLDILKDQKALLEKALKPQPPQKQDTFNERLERIALLRTLGQDKEADRALRDLKGDFDKKVDGLSKTIDEQREKIHVLELKGIKDELLQRIEDLERRPDTLQQAKGLFDLAKEDELMKEVIKAVAKKQLGIEEKKFSLADIAKDFDKIPIGKAKEFVIDVVNAIRGRPEAAPPPPTTAPPLAPSEEEIAAKALPPGLLKPQPEEGTFAAEETTPPEEAYLPPEEGETPPPPPKKPKKGGKKKK